jgi:hypothetical protein
MSATFAGAQIFAAIKVFKVGQKIFFDVLKFKAYIVELVVAIIAEPHQAIFKSAAFTHTLNHQANAAFVPARAVWGIGWA